MGVALSGGEALLLGQLPEHLEGKVGTVGEVVLGEIIDPVDVLEGTYECFLHALILFDAGEFDFEVVLEDEGGLVVVADDLGGPVVLLLQVVGVRLADLLLQPAQVVPPQRNRPRVLRQR